VGRDLLQHGNSLFPSGAGQDKNPGPRRAIVFLIVADPGAKGKSEPPDLEKFSVSRCGGNARRTGSRPRRSANPPDESARNRLLFTGKYDMVNVCEVF
jgi:hypothetical protein